MSTRKQIPLVTSPSRISYFYLVVSQELSKKHFLRHPHLQHLRSIQPLQRRLHQSMSHMLHHWLLLHIYHQLRHWCSSQIPQPIHHVFLIQHLRLIRRYHHNLCLHRDRLFHPLNYLNRLSRRASACTPSWKPRTNRCITKSSNNNNTNNSSINSSWPYKNNWWNLSPPFYKTNIPPQQHPPLIWYQPHQQPRKCKPCWRKLEKTNLPSSSQSQRSHLIVENIGALWLIEDLKCVPGTEFFTTMSLAPSRRH